MAESRGFRLLEGHRKWFWAVAALVAALDQYTKYWLAWPTSAFQGQTELLPFLRVFQRPLNVQGAFSLGPHGSLFYVVLTAVGLVLIGYLFANSSPLRLGPLAALGALCGGAAGNLIDRLVLGGVRDFIDLHWMDRLHWPTFNLADTAICVGVAVLVAEGLLRGKHSDAEAAGNQ